MDTYREMDHVLLDFTDEMAVAASSANELEVEDAFGENDIEYWVPKWDRLVPATAEEIAHIQEWERERLYTRYLAYLHESERLTRRWPAWLLHLREVCAWWLLNARHAGQGHIGNQHL